MQFPMLLDSVAICLKGRKLKDRQANMNGWEDGFVCMELGWKVYFYPSRHGGWRSTVTCWVSCTPSRSVYPTTIVLVRGGLSFKLMNRLFNRTCPTSYYCLSHFCRE